MTLVRKARAIPASKLSLEQGGGGLQGGTVQSQGTEARPALDVKVGCVCVGGGEGKGRPPRWRADGEGEGGGYEW